MSVLKFHFFGVVPLFCSFVLVGCEIQIRFHWFATVALPVCHFPAYSLVSEFTLRFFLFASEFTFLHEYIFAAFLQIRGM